MKKRIIMCVMVAVLVVAMSVSAFAAGETTSMVEVMTSSFTTMISEMMAAIAAILPITLTLVGASLVVAFGIKWFKKIVGKA